MRRGCSRNFISFTRARELSFAWGPKLRVPGKDHQEFDFIIVDLELKAVISIESKATLSVKTGVRSDKSAAAQTQKLKELLEQYFGPELASNDWCFVAMVHFNNFELKQPVCPTCSPFTIHRANQLATKLAGLETHLKKLRPQW